MTATTPVTPGCPNCRILDRENEALAGLIAYVSAAVTGKLRAGDPHGRPEAVQEALVLRRTADRLAARALLELYRGKADVEPRDVEELVAKAIEESIAEIRSIYNGPAMPGEGKG